VVQAWNLRILVLVLVFSEQSIGMFPARHIVAPKIEKQELTKALEEKIPALAQEHGGKLNAILKGNFEESRITSPRSFASVGRQIPKIQVLPGYLTCQDRSGTYLTFFKNPGTYLADFTQVLRYLSTLIQCV